MNARPKRLCRIHSLEFGTFETRPGESLRLGRHAENDIVAQDRTVSRFHARITWQAGLERPVVFDNGSQNGTWVDGVRVETVQPLADNVKLRIGAFVFRIELRGCPEDPALLRHTDEDPVTLFSEDGPDVTGKLSKTRSIQQLTHLLEREQRTGTLLLELHGGQRARIIYCLGRVMSCEVTGDGEGLRALEQILLATSGSYTFTREFELQEETLNLRASEFLRSRNLGGGDSTQRLRRPGR